MEILNVILYFQTESFVAKLNRHEYVQFCVTKFYQVGPVFIYIILYDSYEVLNSYEMKKHTLVCFFLQCELCNNTGCTYVPQLQAKCLSFYSLKALSLYPRVSLELSHIKVVALFSPLQSRSSPIDPKYSYYDSNHTLDDKFYSVEAFTLKQNMNLCMCLESLM